MINQEFKDLIEIRKNWVLSSKQNKFDFDSLLAGLYNDPSHFIFELLQNAEDEKAKEVKFILTHDRLDFYHDGKDFDLEDIEGVTGIGVSKKKDDLTSIGKFGVGFKSVFAVTQSPFIYSGSYQIKIKDFVVPEAVEFNQSNGTLIQLPFNHNTRSANYVFQMISEKLENINLKTMLFLNNIEEIKWQTPLKGGHYLRSSEPLPRFSNTKKVTVVSSNTTEEFLVIEKPIDVDEKKLKVEVAYRLGKDKDGKEIIVPEEDSKLVVYFPTERLTHLHFIIQGPYKTTPNRENIPLSDQQNKIILEENANLVSESFLVIKDLGLLDVSFLNLLPLNLNLYDYDAIYKTMFDVIKKTIIDNELLPTVDGKFCKPSQAVLARGKDLTEFLDSSDLENLYNKKNWIDTNITYDRTRELRDYLTNELSITEIDFENFARKISRSFLSRKSDEWMIDFYSRLLDQSALWVDRSYNRGVLRTKPIIRLEDDRLIEPFDHNGKMQVYLPAETSSQYQTVKRTLIENENSLKFLSELGLSKPDLFAEVKEFILPKYSKDNLIKDDEYFNDFEKILSAYESVPTNKKSQLTEDIKNTLCLYSELKNSGEYQLCKPGKVYFTNAELTEYFCDSNGIYFVAMELYEKFDKDRLNIFLRDIGVEDKPRKIKIESVLDLEWEERYRYVGNTGRDVHKIDFNLDGLENFINTINDAKSILLWKYLVRNIENLRSWEVPNFFEAELNWYYQTTHSKKVESKLLNTLKNKNWLLNKSDRFVKPSEISFSELKDGYLQEGQNIDILKKVLGFKPEIFEQLPEYDRKILEIARSNNLTPEELENLIKEKTPTSTNPDSNGESAVNEDATWVPENNPEDVEPRITDAEPPIIIRPDLTEQTQSSEPGANEDNLNDENSDDNGSTEKSLPDSKSIGEWGEKYVLKTLRDKFAKTGTVTDSEFGFKATRFPDDSFEIIWLNKNHNRGIGYDFVLKKNGDEIEYIEVKTKTKEGDELIKITGVQWEFARKLYDKNEGDKYSIYVVLNAGEANAEIKVLHNPIKLWKDGKLYAHPVNFKL